MSLDFDLINESTNWVRDKLADKRSTSIPDLFLINDIIYPQLLDKLIGYATSDVVWEHEPTSNFRLKTHWEKDSVIEETHVVMESITDMISDIFDQSINFIGISVWKDLPGYSIGKHTDNPLIDVALQIYLLDGPAQLGTKFVYNNVMVTTNYGRNSGYLAGKGIVHYLDSPVPADYTRYSLYSIWSKEQKVINI